MSLKDWKKKTIVYEVYIQSFKDSNNDGIGDINGLESKLDYIKELGANSIWITPIFKSPLVDNGYDIEDYESINPIYGTMSDFEKLLISAHKKNLKIILDLVVNHTSDKHKWFLESKKVKIISIVIIIFGEIQNLMEPNHRIWVQHSADLLGHM